jgi:predicted ArsR family transcriptional regulator
MYALLTRMGWSPRPAGKESQMLEILSDRQKSLLKLLLRSKPGMTVDELSKGLKITRNAVRQHLAALDGNGLITQGASRPSGGRPHQLYALTEKGNEMFPRHYTWFAQLVLESVKNEHGAEGLGKRLDAIGSGVAKQLRSQYPALDTREQKVGKLAEVMDQLGYDAKIAAATRGAPVIEADNCVFHSLAIKDPEICRLDLALLETFTDSRVEHQECMARGGNVCRFKFMPKKP